MDYAESQLHKQIGEGSTSATIFYLKTKGKSRGYIERQEITGADGDNLFHVKVIDEEIQTNKVYKHLQRATKKIVVEQGGTRSGKTYNILLC